MMVWGLNPLKKKDSVAVVSLEKHWNLNAKRNPQIWIRWPTGRWAALYITWREGKSF